MDGSNRIGAYTTAGQECPTRRRSDHAHVSICDHQCCSFRRQQSAPVLQLCDPADSTGCCRPGRGMCAGGGCWGAPEGGFRGRRPKTCVTVPLRSLRETCDVGRNGNRSLGSLLHPRADHSGTDLKVTPGVVDEWASSAIVGSRHTVWDVQIPCSKMLSKFSGLSQSAYM
jgi:hypothetical protein